MQGGVQATPNAPRTNVVEMGRYLAQNGISVEQACPFWAFQPPYIWCAQLTLLAHSSALTSWQKLPSREEGVWRKHPLCTFEGAAPALCLRKLPSL